MTTTSLETAVAAARNEVAMFEAGAAEARRQHQELYNQTVAPIETALGEAKARLEAAELDAARAAYVALGHDDPTRERHFANAVVAASRAYEVARALPAAPVARIDRRWNEFRHGFQASKSTIGHQVKLGVFWTKEDHVATWYPRLLAIAEELRAYSALDPMARLQMRQQDSMAA